MPNSQSVLSANPTNAWAMIVMGFYIVFQTAPTGLTIMRILEYVKECVPQALFMTFILANVYCLMSWHLRLSPALPTLNLTVAVECVNPTAHPTLDWTSWILSVSRSVLRIPHIMWVPPNVRPITELLIRVMPILPLKMPMLLQATIVMIPLPKITTLFLPLIMPVKTH